MQWLIRSVLVAALISCAHAGDWNAQKDFPGVDGDVQIRRAIERAERAYRKGNYKQAMWLYETRLVVIGDKFAQYMVGYMYANGEGIERNPETAAAWFLLAAERGHPELVKNSEAALSALSAESRERVRRQAESLRAEIGDQELLRRLLLEDKESMRQQTGSRSERCNQNGRITLPDGDNITGAIPVAHFCEMMKERIAARESYLEQYTVHGDIGDSEG